MSQTSMKGAPRSKEFDDVYFSVADGLAETRFVFLERNDLPERFLGRNEFTIFETGFGTGLNFLATWQLFKAHATVGQRLHFISVEKYPLSALQIQSYLHPFAHEFPDLLPALVKGYPDPVSGRHDIAIDDHVRLSLCIGDMNDIIPAVSEQIDCWFLDGFKPSTNPEMWSPTLFSNMARLSKTGARFSTFTAAGFVKRGLREVGFEVQKMRGFGTKRDMLVGEFRGCE
ncbi:MAG: hypothetical protein CMH27_03805 [Micavibrio sp.]|nr:hypothetical protein [Micavibrio sp.]